MQGTPDAAGQPARVDINAVVLTGYLVKAPELRATRRHGRQVLLRLAIRRSASQFDYVDVLVKDEQAEQASRLTQGQRLLVTGRLQRHRWRTMTGTSRCKHAIVDSALEPLAALPDAPQPTLSPAT